MPKRSSSRPPLPDRRADALVEIPQLESDLDSVFTDTGAPLNKRFLDLIYPRVPSGGATQFRTSGLRLAGWFRRRSGT